MNNTSERNCGKCNGSGTFLHFGACFECNGTGVSKARRVATLSPSRLASLDDLEAREQLRYELLADAAYRAYRARRAR
jgi:DnaJ-class molecular chaperone